MGLSGPIIGDMEMPYVPSRKTPNLEDDRKVLNPAINKLAKAIAKVAKRHGYDGAFAGELNYAVTRLLQEIPRELVKEKIIPDEIKYWIQPLMYGVLMDVVLEHKRRVNVPYEAHQILKNGDCYDTPYYTKIVEILDECGEVVGLQEVMLKRSDNTVKLDKVKFCISATTND
jgi:hypothetical protein